LRRLLPCVLLVALAIVAAGGAAARTRVGACRASSLAASFAGVPGSAGAGNIVYVLRLRNTSHAACTVTGLPKLVLVGRAGRALPTHVATATPGILTSVLVTLRPGGYASANARFSPDVPGPGEPVAGMHCEPVAYRARVTAPGGGTLLAPLLPPTSVCEHGQLSFSPYVAGKNGPPPPGQPKPSISAAVSGRTVTVDGSDWKLGAECAVDGSLA
jgi:hypothetical protein